MALRENPLMGLIATSVIASSAVAFGIAEVTVLDSSVSEFVMFLLPLSMVLGYALSDVQSGMMENWEMGALVLPTGLFLASKYVPSVNDVITQYQPTSGVILVGVSILGFYVIVE